MENDTIARVAVSGVSYWFDRPYSYAVPEQFKSQLFPGMRVAVPFGGSRPREGVVLALAPGDGQTLKKVLALLDEAPILTEEQLRLALWMRERFFCTVSDAVRAILPAGLWYKVSAMYTPAPGFDRERAYAAAGKSKLEKLALDAVFAHDGS